MLSGIPPFSIVFTETCVSDEYTGLSMSVQVPGRFDRKTRMAAKPLREDRSLDFLSLCTRLASRLGAGSCRSVAAASLSAFPITKAMELEYRRPGAN